MNPIGENYLVFAIACLVIALVMARLLLRERVTLQGSLSFLAFLLVLGLMAVFPTHTQYLATKLGFTVVSNFLFRTALAAPALLHLRALVPLSKGQLRTTALPQELAVLQAKIDRFNSNAGNRVSELRP